MSILSAVKNYGSNVVGGAKIVGSAIKSAVTPTPAKAMQFPVGQGLNPTQTASAYQAISNAAKPIPQLAGTTGSNIPAATAALTRAVSNPVQTAKNIGSNIASNFAGGSSPSSLANGGGGMGSLAGDSSASQVAAPVLSTNQYQDSYNGSPGITTVTSSAGSTPRGGYSLEAQAKQQADAQAGDAASARRAANQDILTQGTNNREAQKAALQAQLTEAQKKLADTQAGDLNGDGTVDATESLFAKDDTQSSAYEKQIADLQKAVEDTNQLSPEEKQAQAESDAYTAKEAAINAQVRDEVGQVNSQPIPQGFLTGQSKGIMEKGNSALTTIAAQKIPLQQKLANLLANRKLAQDAAKNSLTNAQSLYANQSERSKQRRDYQISQNAAIAKTKAPVEVNAGSAYYDPTTGKVLYKNPKTFAPSKASALDDLLNNLQ